MAPRANRIPCARSLFCMCTGSSDRPAFKGFGVPPPAKAADTSAVRLAGSRAAKADKHAPAAPRSPLPFDSSVVSASCSLLFGDGCLLRRGVVGMGWTPLALKSPGRWTHRRRAHAYWSHTQRDVQTAYARQLVPHTCCAQQRSPGRP